MAEGIGVKVVLSAQDAGFSSAMKSASSAVESLKSRISSGLGFKTLTIAGKQAFSAIKSEIADMAGELNSSSAAWKSFTVNMQMNGKAEGEMKAIKKELLSFAEQTAYSSSNLAGTFAQLETAGTKNTVNLVKGLGGLAAAAENPVQAMETLSARAAQMASKPAVAWSDFQQMLEQTPAGIAAVAKEMGMSAGELIKNVQDGTVATDDFFDAVSKAGTNGSFTKLAAEYKTVDQALDGLRKTAADKLQPAFDSLSDVGIKAVGGIVDKLGEIDGEAVAGKVMAAFDTISGYWKTFSSAVSDTGVFKALQNAAVNLGSAVSHVFSSLADSGALKATGAAIGNIVKAASNAVGAVSKFVSGMNPNLLTGIVGGLMGVKTGFRALDFLKNLNPFGLFKGKAEEALGGVTAKTKGASSQIGSFIKSLGTSMSTLAKGLGTSVSTMAKGLGTSLSTMAKGLGTGISTALQGAGKGISTAFKGIGTALKMVNPATLLALGAAVSGVVTAFTLLATQGDGVAVMLQGAGTAVSTILQGIGTAIGIVIESIVPLAAQIAPLVASIGMAFGNAAPFVTALGTAVAEVAAAIGSAVSQIITALVPVVEMISGIFIQVAEVIGQTIVGIVSALAPFIPAVTTAFTTIAAVVANAVVQIVQALAPYAPEIARMVEATAESIQSICNVFQQLIEEISPVIQSVSELISQFGDTVSQIFSSLGDVVAEVGESIAVVFGSIGEVISSVGESVRFVLDGIADVIQSVGESARNAGEGFKLVAEGISLISELSVVDIAKSLGAVALGLGEIAGKGEGLQTAAAGMTGISEALGTAAASASILNMLFVQLSVMAVKAASGITAMNAAFAGIHIPEINVSPVMTALFSITAAAGMMASSLTAAGLQAGSGFLGGIQSGLMRVPGAAVMTMSQFGSALASGGIFAVVTAGSISSAITSALTSASGGAYRAGYNIGIGLANGMNACLGRVRSTAARLAAAAEAAVIAKAKIGSPSRVFHKLGEYVGEGFANGLDAMRDVAARSSEELVTIPALSAGPEISVHGIRSEGPVLSGDYDYNRKTVYTIIVPVEYDGREMARVTAQFTQQELEKRERRSSRKMGNR